MTDSGLEPRDLELIAAFIDRRLSEEERRTFQERLDSEEALYEVFTETVRYRDQRAAGPAVVIEHPARRSRWGRLAAVAALVAVGVTTPLLLRYLSAKRHAEVLVADGGLELAPGREWFAQGWRRTRGIDSSLEGADAAFRAGVRILDLEVAVRLGRDDDALILTERLKTIVDTLELPELLQAHYAAVRGRLEAGAPDEELIALIAQAETALGVQYPDLAAAHRLGYWAEAGKLAARSGNRRLLASRTFRGEARELGRPEAPWDEAVAAALEETAALLAAPAAELDLPALEAAFVAIIREG